MAGTDDKSRSWEPAPDTPTAKATPYLRADADMAKVIECGAVVPGCNFVIHGVDEAEIMVKMAEHLRSAHDVEHLSEQLKVRIRAVIRDD